MQAERNPPEEVRIMTENTNNSNVPCELDDADLSEVSGGSIAISIMELADYLPEDSRTFVYSMLDGTIAGERRFLTALESELELHGKDHAAAIVKAHRKYYWNRTFPE